MGYIGAMLINLARLSELSVTQHMEISPRFGSAQSTAWAHLARERGNLETIAHKLNEVNRDRL